MQSEKLNIKDTDQGMIKELEKFIKSANEARQIIRSFNIPMEIDLNRLLGEAEILLADAIKGVSSWPQRYTDFMDTRGKSLNNLSRTKTLADLMKRETNVRLLCVGNVLAKLSVNEIDGLLHDFTLVDLNQLTDEKIKEFSQKVDYAEGIIFDFSKETLAKYLKELERCYKKYDNSVIKIQIEKLILEAKELLNDFENGKKGVNEVREYLRYHVYVFFNIADYVKAEERYNKLRGIDLGSLLPSVQAGINNMIQERQNELVKLNVADLSNVFESGILNLNSKIDQTETFIDLEIKDTAEEVKRRNEQVKELHKKLDELNDLMQNEVYSTQRLLLNVWSFKDRDYSYERNLSTVVNTANERAKEAIEGFKARQAMIAGIKGWDIERGLSDIENKTKEILENWPKMLGQIEGNKNRLSELLEQANKIIEERKKELDKFDELYRYRVNFDVYGCISQSISLGLLETDDAIYLRSWKSSNTLLTKDKTKITDEATDELWNTVNSRLEKQKKHIAYILKQGDDLRKTLAAISLDMPLNDLRKNYDLMLKQLLDYQRSISYILKTVFTLGLLSSRKELNKLGTDLTNKINRIDKEISKVDRIKQSWADKKNEIEDVDEDVANKLSDGGEEVRFHRLVPK